MLIHKRRSIRLKYYDYSSAGYYFITICTKDSTAVFGKIFRKLVRLNKFGLIAREEWIKTAQIRPYINLDEFVIMPDHMHGIIIINEYSRYMTPLVGATGLVAPTTLKPYSLGSIIGQYKSVVTKKIRKIGLTNFKWQRNFYEHIIRNEKELYNIRQYIINNPAKCNPRKKDKYV